MNRNLCMLRKLCKINPRHPIIKELQKKSSEDAADKSLIDLANLLYDSALLQSGFSMRDTNDFATRIHRVVSVGLAIDPSAVAEEEPAEAEEAPAADEKKSEDAPAEEAAETGSHDEL